MDANQATSLTDQFVLNVDLIVPNAIMNQFVLYAMMDLLTFTKEVADVQMDFGMMELSVKNAGIIVHNVLTI